MGINLGAFFSPLVCGTLAVKFGFEYGFAAAGIGMLIGFTLYKVFEHKLLGDSGLYPVTKTQTKEDDIVESDSNSKNVLFHFLL